jgi:very-short-patch-repair endonuclease
MPVYDLERQDRSARRAEHKREQSIELRKQATVFERRLWRHLRGQQLEGCRFRRQHPIGRYIVDFVCLERKLVVELDGQQHSGPEGYDGKRDTWLRVQGYEVLRFSNRQLMDELENVLLTIAARLHPPP